MTSKAIDANFDPAANQPREPPRKIPQGEPRDLPLREEVFSTIVGMYLAIESGKL
jgi:hypothetical protein